MSASTICGLRAWRGTDDPPHPKLRTTCSAANASCVPMTFTQNLVAILRTLVSLILLASIPFSGMDVTTASGCGLFQACNGETDSHIDSFVPDPDAAPADTCSEHKGGREDGRCIDDCPACGCTGPTLFVSSTASPDRDAVFFERSIRPQGPPTHASDGASSNLFRPPRKSFLNS